MDITTVIFPGAQAKVLTDIVRTELFKQQAFRIIDRGLVEARLTEQRIAIDSLTNDSTLITAGKTSGADKILITTIERYNDTYSVSMRIVDLATSVIEFIELTSSHDETAILALIPEMVARIGMTYKSEAEMNLGDNRIEYSRRRWELIGVSAADIDYLTSNRISIGDYYDLKQYDARFTVEAFIAAKKAGWETKIIAQFLQAGISYPELARALKLGIVNLYNFRTQFKPRGLSFSDYLDAYERQIPTADAYLDYREHYRQDRLVFGLGWAADSVPVTSAVFSWPLGIAGWEHFWNREQRQWWKVSTSAGLALGDIMMPIPFLQSSFYAGAYPYFFTVGAGGYVDVVFGSHYAGYLRFGIEILESIELSWLSVWGNQPNPSYYDFTTRVGSPGYRQVKYPFYCILFTWKI
ncbi:MAG: hypothetical protein HZC28_00705 [Spirochaetes bacterium]|nr:hypothetical protein [Spirochaetota bacterium]